MGEAKRFPRLRRDLEIQDLPEGRFAAAIEDGSAGIRIRLDRTGREIARLLDGTRGLDEIRSELSRSGLFISRNLMEKTLEFFERHGILEREGEIQPAPGEVHRPPIRSGSFVLRSGPSEAPSRIFFLPEARHGCLGCGLCCRGYTIGPIESDAAERIRNARFEGDLEWLNRSRKIQEGESAGIRYLQIEKADGRCIFQEPGGSCILHRTRGEAFKPAGCRLFPLQFALLPTGDLIGSLRMECFQYHKARNLGEPFARRIEEIRALQALAVDFRILPERVKVGPDREIPFQEYLGLEEKLMEGIGASPEGFEEILLALGRAVARISKEERAGGIRLEALDWAAGGTDRLIRSLLSFIHGLGELAGKAAAADGGDRFSTDLLGAFSAIALAYAGEGKESDREALETGPSPDSDPRSREILREVLRNEIFSKEWILGGDMARGFAFSLVRNLLFTAGARILADHGKPPATSLSGATALSTAIVNRALRHLGARSWRSEFAAPLDGIFRCFLE